MTPRLPLLTMVVGLLGLFALGATDPRPVPDGARVSLTFTKGASFVLGDVIETTFTLSNAGAQSFNFETGGDYRGTGFPTRYRFSVVDEIGNALPAETWVDMGGLMVEGGEELKSGGQNEQVLLLQNYVRVNRPGTFTVRVTHDFGWKATPEKPLPVAEARITITLPTAEQAERRARAVASREQPLKKHELGSYWHTTEFRYLAHPVFLPALEKLSAEGQVIAMEGIHRIETKAATLALMRLLDSERPPIVHAAALFLSRRMPPRMVGGHPRTPPSWLRTPEETAALAALWVTEAAEPLRKAAATLLRSNDLDYVNTGAFIIEVLGTASDGAVLLNALAATLKESKLRETPGDDILDAPGAGDALIAALEGLRERGYRAPRSGGIEIIMAQFLELGDPTIVRRAGWEQTLEAFFAQNPPMLREAAVRALPKPPTGKWEKLLSEALNDRDRGVMLQACVTAGESRNPVFTEPLANIVRVERNTWVVDAASNALTKIGSHWEATEAWIERLGDEALHDEGLRFLAEKLEHPKSNGSGGRTDTPREIRFAMRAKWQRFFSDEERQALIRLGKPVPVTEQQARDLFGETFHFIIEGGRWPGEKQ